MIIPGRAPVLKRLPSRIDPTEGIQRFDTDNLYPQRAKETMYRSYTVSGVIEKLAGFLNGEGFVDPALNDLIVFKDGLKEVTLREILDKAAHDMAWANGFALHFQYNLNLTWSHITYVPFEYCRLGIQDEDGNVNKIMYCTNWERDYMKEQRDRVIIEYDRFNPDPSAVAEQIALCGGIQNYKGQILYFSLAGEDQYPKCSFDPVFEQAQAQAEISLFALNNVVNGFTAGHIMMYPGKFETDDDRNAFVNRIKKHKGAMGANTIMVVETGTTDSNIKATDLIVKTELPNNDKLYEFTLNWIEKSILQNYGMPYEILGKVPDTGLFTKQQVEDAYTYYNAVTRDKRVILSRTFKWIFKYYHTPIESDFAIQPQQYDIEGNMAAAQQQMQVERPVNQTLTNLTGRQKQNYDRMIREFTNGKKSWMETKTLLQSAFGFSDDEINVLIGENPTANAGLPN